MQSKCCGNFQNNQGKLDIQKSASVVNMKRFSDSPASVLRFLGLFVQKIALSFKEMFSMDWMCCDTETEKRHENAFAVILSVRTLPYTG